MEFLISEEFNKLNKQISCIIQNNENNLFEVERKYLESLFGVHWDRLQSESQIALMSAGILWKSISNNLENSRSETSKLNFDYSGICISVTSALELELKKCFFTGFQDFLEREYGKPNADKWEKTFEQWPEILLSTTQHYFKKNEDKYKRNPEKNKKPELMRKEEFVIGKMPFLFGVFKEEFASQEQVLLIKKQMRRYLETIVQEQYKDRALEIFVTRETGKSFVDKCEDIRKLYRNKAAHAEIISQEQAYGCYHDVVGKFELYDYTKEVTGILLYLFSMLK